MSERSVDEILETLVVEPDPVYWAGHRDGAAAERDRIREAVEGLHAAVCLCPFDGTDPDCYLILDSAAVLRLLEAPHVE